MSAALSRERILRAARIYRTTADAARALGVNSGSFARACRRQNIESPNDRRTRLAATAAKEATAEAAPSPQALRLTLRQG